MITEIASTELFILAEKYLNKKEDAILVRACSDPAVFEKNRFCKSYKVLKKDRLCALMTFSCGLLSIYAIKMPEIKELCSFISALGAFKVECSKNLFNKIKRHLEYEEALFGKVYYFDKKLNKKDFLAEKTEDASLFYDTVKISHKVYENIPFEAFYCDYFYRKALPATLFLTQKDGKAIATAAIMHGYKNTKILSDISVIPEERRKGYAEDIVLKAISDVYSEGKTPMLFCTAKGAMKLYEKLGFKVQQKFVYITF